MKRVLIILLIVVLQALPAVANVPYTMNIQGVLTDNSGNPLTDGNYTVEFQLWDAATAGSIVWTELNVVVQENGIFNSILGDATAMDPQDFSQTVWLGMVVSGEPPSEPRIELTSVATALRAASVDPGAAVRTLNGLTNNINLEAGTNVTITQVDTTLVISATAGAGGDDGDWLINGENISRATGRVYVGYDPAKDSGPPPGRSQEDADKDPYTSKMTISGDNEGLYVLLNDAGNLSDGLSAIFARRARVDRNDGTGYGLGQANTAITGFNDWGDSFSFAMAGYSWFDFPQTGAILGARRSGSHWGALGYFDINSVAWGMYTPNSLYVGEQTETNSLKVTAGATAGYILTSDADGNATWMAPGASGTDDDWIITAESLYHSPAGAVAIGTTAPHNHGDSATRTTLQVSALYSPALALDAISGGLTRWTMSQNNGAINFNKSDSYGSTGTTTLALDTSVLEVRDINANTSIRLQGTDSMTTGSSLQMYGTSTSTSQPMVFLDSQVNSSEIGGSMILRDKFGNEEINITANHNNTNAGRITTPVLEITGGSDLSEQFDVGNTSLLTRPGMVVSIDPDHPGQLTLSTGAYDRRVAGVISGAGGVNTGMLMGQRGSEADGELPVALVGRVYVWADASNGPIQPGDMLTTSDRPGHAMKVEDYGQATGAILGKAMSGLEEGQGLILTLVTLQ